MLNTLIKIKEYFIKNIYNMYLCDAFFVNKGYNILLMREYFLKMELFNTISVGFMEDDIELSDIVYFSNITINSYYNTYNKQNSSYKFTQTSPLNIWVIVHNLGYFPSQPLVTDLSGNEIEGTTVNNSINMSTITFSSPQSGYAYFS